MAGRHGSRETTLSRQEMDIARSIQEVTEEVVLRLARTVHRELGTDYLCLAGGVALNCVANGRILREGPFRDIWIQPAAGDAGGRAGRGHWSPGTSTMTSRGKVNRPRCHGGLLPGSAV